MYFFLVILPSDKDMVMTIFLITDILVFLTNQVHRWLHLKRKANPVHHGFDLWTTPDCVWSPPHNIHSSQIKTVNLIFMTIKPKVRVIKQTANWWTVITFSQYYKRYNHLVKVRSRTKKGLLVSNSWTQFIKITLFLDIASIQRKWATFLHTTRLPNRLLIFGNI